MKADPFFEALISEIPNSDIPTESRIYDGLLGSWTARVVDYFDDGTSRQSSGEWHFARVLEGRAIQDIWICPARDDCTPNTSKTRNRYGSSLRFYHPQEKRWHVVWINPVSGAFDHLVGHRDETGIRQEGRDADGNLMRWCFTDIQENSARWTGERSRDGGQTWKLEAEFFLTRSSRTFTGSDLPR